jgi:hypothetical protein
MHGMTCGVEGLRVVVERLNHGGVGARTEHPQLPVRARKASDTVECDLLHEAAGAAAVFRHTRRQRAVGLDDGPPVMGFGTKKFLAA